LIFPGFVCIVCIFGCYVLCVRLISGPWFTHTHSLTGVFSSGCSLIIWIYFPIIPTIYCISPFQCCVLLALYTFVCNVLSVFGCFFIYRATHKDRGWSLLKLIIFLGIINTKVTVKRQAFI